MAFRSFLEDLFSHGKVIVASHGENLEESAELQSLLSRFEFQIRPTLPPNLPEFLPEIAFWAATRLYRICQFLMDRDIPETIICEDLLLNICPIPRSPEVDYSADLTLRFLPSLQHLVQTRPQPDPLRAALRQFGREWPLSSVGLLDLGGDLPTHPFRHHEALRKIYLDRIIEQQDWTRLDEDWIKPYWKQWIGAYSPKGYPE